MKTTNHLTTQASLYLQQHADNPVNWYPWGAEALAKARLENKPILLSIGYSACHWCHVMAAESFADPDTAKIMNEHFINIKVDREERPDLDKIYQLAQQLLTNRPGGWPLTLFLSPDKQVPFFGGTYFPPEARHGLPGFKDLLIKIADYFQTNKNEIDRQDQRLQQALQHLTQYPVNEQAIINAEPLLKAQQELTENFDQQNGGFGTAPKFPHPGSLLFLLRTYAESLNGENSAAAAMANLTLTKMAQAGIYDQIGGGFYRYSVDAQWQIPHFEKMLYDNGQLLTVYAQAAALFKDDLFKTVAQETAEWILRDMTAPSGAFYATLDADAEHVEGKFYYWDLAELKTLLTAEEYSVVAAYYNLQRPANFEGHWHLHITQTLAQVAASLQIDSASANNYLQTAREKLLAARNQRIWPGLDQKILTAWNALTIKGLALAGQVLNRPDFITAAFRAVDFIWEQLFKDNRLFACYQNNQACLPAYLDDYAFLLDALLTLLQVNWRAQDLQFAIAIADSLLTYFADEANGGFYFTAHDHEPLLQRPKSLMDEAVPAGNGVAAYALGRLGHLIGESRYWLAGEKTLKMAWQSIESYPSAYASFLQALADQVQAPKMIILRGSLPELKQWQHVCQSAYWFNKAIFAIPADETFLPGILANYSIRQQKTLAYACIGQRCLAPIDNIEALQLI